MRCFIPQTCRGVDNTRFMKACVQLTSRSFYLVSDDKVVIRDSVPADNACGDFAHAPEARSTIPILRICTGRAAFLQSCCGLLHTKGATR